MRFWQPEHAKTHLTLSRAEMVAAYRRLGFTCVRARCVGTFSMDIVAWEIAPRWPGLAARSMRAIRFASAAIDRLLILFAARCGTRSFAPFIVVEGCPPGDLAARNASVLPSPSAATAAISSVPRTGTMSRTPR